MAAVRKFLLIGPGSIGAFVAARALEAGHRGWIACRTDAAAQSIAASGLVATDAQGRTTSVQARTVVEPRPLDVDVVVLATKCRSTVQAWRAWAPHVPPDAAVLALQNGLMGHKLEPFAKGRLVLATVAYPARQESMGTVRQLAKGGYFVGAWGGAPSGLVDAAADILGASGPVRRVGNIEGVQWTKLLVNSAMTGLCILTGGSVGETLADRRAREAVRRMMGEGLAAGEAAGVQFERLQGFHPRMLAPQASHWPLWLQHAMMRAYSKKYGAHTSSSLPDLQRGLETEIPYLNGAVAEVGRDHGVSTPCHDSLIAAVAAIEAGQMAPSFGLLNRLE